jgi:dihydrofolate reductase
VVGGPAANGQIVVDDGRGVIRRAPPSFQLPRVRPYLPDPFDRRIELGAARGRPACARSGVLLRWLLANDLVDQFDLVLYPVVIGQGTRLFPDSNPDSALDLVNSRTTPGA